MTTPNEATDRQQHRQVFVDAWTMARAGQPLTPLQQRIAQIVAAHPDLHALLESGAGATQREFAPGQSGANPFLHLGLHLAVVEQIAIDQPPGIHDLYRTLLARLGDAHRAEHRLMDCLAAGLERVQHGGQPFDTQDYLDCAQRGLR